MGFYKQFESFNPVSGDVPDEPFSILPSIAWRARSLLKTRTAEQIASAAEVIDWAIDTYFQSEKDEAIAKLLRGLYVPRRYKREPATVESDYDVSEEFFYWDGGSRENGRWVFKEGMEDQLDIPTAENTSEVDVLKDSNCWYVLDDDSGDGCLPDGKVYEYFAVLSLWLLADSLEWLKHNGAPSVRFSLAGEYALKAMDAVCYGEHLQAIERINEAHIQEKATKQSEDKKQRSLKAQALNIARHRKDYEAKDLVIKEWEKDKSKFSSGEKAGIHFADWLLRQGVDAESKSLYDYQPRQVATWLRSYAKQIGVRFR